MAYERKTLDILISDDLREVLKEIESESVVASLLLKSRHSKEELVENPINYISISTQDRTKISYLTPERTATLTEDVYWTSSRRFQAKPGSFISKLFKDVPAKEVEKFSNLFKSQALRKSFEFKIVTGEEIRKFYHYDSYSRNDGTLGASCMKHDGCQKFLDIYSDNKDSVSMLVMVDNDNRLLGRALLWNAGDYKIMDRIYTVCDEEFLFYFKQWGTKNGYFYKSEQNWYNTLFFEQLGGVRTELKLEVKMDVGGFRTYPYVDTFKFIDMNTGFLYNYIPEDSDIKILCASDGSKYESDYLRLDSIDKIFRHRSECVYVSYLNIYTSNNNVHWSEINDQYILSEDSLYDNDIDDYIFNDKFSKFNDDSKIEKRKNVILERRNRGRVHPTEAFRGSIHLSEFGVFSALNSDIDA